jgi:2-desacetyl-2-hydroxyethyl bacteriochlorophyllide A dehydrogenase
VKAVMFTEQRDFELAQRPVPVAGDGMVLLEVEMCGICGTDLHAAQLDGLFAPPVVVGHEFTASIAGLGKGVTGWAQGERVVVNPIALVCGTCPPCLAALPNQCVKALSSNCCGVGKDGGMAEYVAVEVAHLHRLPEAVSPQVGAWTEPLAVAVRGVRRSGLKVGESVAVVGAGPIGQLTLQVARAAGAGEALVVETSNFRRQTALRCGASEAVAPDGVADVDRRYDVVFDCTGAPAAVDTAVELAGHAGRIVVIGTYTGAPTLSEPMVAHMKEVTISFSVCYQDQAEFVAALGLLERGAVDVAPLTTRVAPLEDHAAAFAEMREPDQAIKVLLTPSP